MSGPEGRAEAERTAVGPVDHSPAPDATEGQAETSSAVVGVPQLTDAEERALADFQTKVARDYEAIFHEPFPGFTKGVPHGN